MEQRALLASALVLGCVTAAGAGGYLAVNQMGATAPEPVARVGTSQGETPDPIEGTVADIAPVPPTPAPDSSIGSQPAPTPRTERPIAAPPPRAVTAPAPRAAASQAPASSRPVAATPRAQSSPARSAPVSRPSTDTHTAPATARDSAPASESWPSRDSGTTSGQTTWPSRDTTGATATADAALPSRTPVTEPSAPPAPVRRLESVTIPADAVINVQLETGVSSVNAKVEDAVRARITRDVVAGGDVVIPAGSRLLGSVTLVDEGGRLRERSRLGIRFHTLVLADGTEVRLPTETIYREGESPAGRSAAKIGGATVGGAILGAIMGGGKGAVIGAATGAGSGTGWAMAGDRRPAELRPGQALAVRVSDSVSTQVER